MEQHINLCSEGMSLDVHPSLQPPNSYREALNGNLISKGGNVYSFESTEGTVLNWTIPTHKTGSGKFVPIGIFPLGNRLLIHSTDNEAANGGDGEIGIVTFNNAGVGTYSAKYYHADLRYSMAHMIFGYGLEENDAYHRSYWTDNYNQLRSINTAASILNTLYTTGNLVVGDQYMVLTDSIGSITHNGVVYGPKQTAGNIFTAVNANFTTSGSVKVIKLLQPNILNYTPEKTVGTIDFNRYTFGGALICGVKMYCYRLYTIDGYQSSWSVVSNPIHVGPSSPTNGYQQYVGAGNNALGASTSGKAIELTISDISLDFDKIQVGVIEMDAGYGVIRNMEIFWDTAISGTSMTVTHVGTEHLATLTLADLSLTNAVIINAKTLATIKQRQVIANLTTQGEIDMDLTGSTIQPFIYTVPGDENGLGAGGGQFAFKHRLAPAAGITNGTIIIDGTYVVKTAPVTYDGTVYAVGETFKGTSAGGASWVGGGTVKGCIRIKQYTTFAGDDVYKVVELNDEFFDYKSMASHMYLKGYWREETYRFGVLGLDKFGNPLFVRFLNDVTVPSQSYDPGDASQPYKLINQYGTDAAGNFSLNIVGMVVNGLDITDYKDSIGAICIVRVPRDKQILAQGLIQQCVQKSGEAGTFLPMSDVMPSEDYHVNAQGHTNGFLWGLMGPELDFNLSAFPIPLQQGDKLRVAADLQALDNGIGYGFDNINVNAQDIYSKFYKHNKFTPYTGGANTNAHDSDISTVITFDRNAGTDEGTVNSAVYFKNYDIATKSGHSIGSVGSPGDLNEKAAAGGLRAVIATAGEDFFNASNGNTGTGSQVGDVGTTRKILANYVRPKSTAALYGGNSLAAKSANEYIFCGHMLKIDSALLASIVDGSGNYILNGMEVFGGDCFVNIYDRVNALFDDYYNSNFLNNGSYSYGFIFPCESEVNVALREGVHMSNTGLHDNGLYWQNGGLSNSERFEYNLAYSNENAQIKYPALPLGFVDVNRFPYMARYSQQKILGEPIDNMRVFLENNYRNADALHGEINNLAVGFDRLFFWQNKGVGYLPVDEKEATVGSLGAAIQLGIGGVLQRYDTIDKFYGNQHQSGLVTGEDFFEWVDLRRFSVVRMSFNGQVMDMSLIKGIQTYMQNAFVSAEPDASNILNIDQPILGQGIIGVYDPIKKTVYHTFKFSSLEGARKDLKRNRDFTIGISRQVDKFVGFFSFAPVIYIEHNSKVYAAKKTRQGILGSIDYSVYDEVMEDGDTYVCVLAYTSAATPVAASTDTTHWVKTSQQNQIHRMFIGDICKFFGIVYPHYITMVVNPAIGEAKSYDRGETYGNNVQYTDVYCASDTQLSQDTSISSTSRNYKFYDDKWHFTYPLDGRERITGAYMTVKLQVKNYLTDITTSLNLQKRLVYLKTLFRVRK